MSRTWYDVWAARTLPAQAASPLAALLAADGMDTGFGSVTEAAWRDFVAAVAVRLGGPPGRTVFEVGCGAGAFLLPLHEAGCRVAGLDQSPALIDLARRFLPGGDFRVAAATSLDLQPCAQVLAMGVFLYFPDHAYAQAVLRRMAAKATQAVAILDIPDAARRDEAVTMRRGYMTPTEYRQKYAGLDHLYFDREQVRAQLLAAGCRRVAIEDQCLAGYANGRFRFNAFGWLD